VILRKPYALLIKNFKKIHLVLCVFMAYIAYRSSNIFTFFNDLINHGTFDRTAFSLPSTYINIYMFIITIFIVAVTLVIYILMREKKKPKLLYLLIIFFYLALIIFFFGTYNTLEAIEISTMNPRTLRIIRDITGIICYVQYAFIILIAIRALGFNIKKFNFGEDLAELKIDVSDNEEFELNVGIDSRKIGRNLRRGKREVKYFVVENFFVLSLISLVLVTFLGIGVFLNTQVYNKVHSQYKSFKVNNFIVQANESTFTRMNQRGIEITPDGKIFVISNITFKNVDNKPHKLDLDDINLTFGKDIFSPIISRYQSFLDLGTGYINQSIKAGETRTFIFVFEVDEKVKLNKLIFRYRESLHISPAKLEAKYKRIRLNGKINDEVVNVDGVKMNEELSFESSSLGKTKLKINDVQIADLFIYEAKACSGIVCNIYQNNLTMEYTTEKATLMKLSFDYIKDPTTVINNVAKLSHLVNSFGSIYYSVGSKNYSTELSNVTPSNYNGSDLYYKVSSNIKNADSIQLVFCIRDKQFVYKLK